MSDHAMPAFAAFLCLICISVLSRAENQDTPQEVPRVLFRQFIEDVNTSRRLSDEETEALTNNLKCELNDLNGDSVPEYFLYVEHHFWCGAGANCSYWIYQRTEQGYELIIEDKELKARDTTTNGYRDIASETPMGFCSRNVQRLYVTLYKYDGEEYQPQPTQVECRPFTPEN